MPIFDFFTGLVGRDMGIDLGTVNSMVYVRGKGIVLREPSVVAINRDNKDILAVGSEAKRMVGRTPSSIVAIKPLRDGVISDFDITQKMLRHFINKVHRFNFFARPRVIICVPSGITGVERRAVIEAAEQSGVRAVYILEEPMAAAIGTELPVSEPIGHMIVDIGGGTTEIAVISLGGIVVSQSIRIAGNEMDEAIINMLKRDHNLLIGETTAEAIKIEIGSAFTQNEEETVEARGRDLVTGLPKSIILSSKDVRDALDETLNAITSAIVETFDKTPPELIADIYDNGIMMVGGGSLLKGMSDRLKHHTKCEILTTENPLEAVVLGAGKCIENFELFKDLISHERGV